MRDIDLGLNGISNTSIGVLATSSPEAIEAWEKLNWIQKIFKRKPEKDISKLYIIDHDTNKIYYYEDEDKTQVSQNE